MKSYIKIVVIVFLAINFSVTAQQIGVFQYGGYVFHVNEDGSGLVVDIQDLGSGINWHDAMSAAENSSAQGYNDWYLPSESTLEYIHDVIGSPEYNIMGFSDSDFWWSSTEPESGYARIVTTCTGILAQNKNNTHSPYCGYHPIKARAIREFQFTEVFGCLDPEASNYNPYANTDNDSCISWQELAADLQVQIDNIIPEDGITQYNVDSASLNSYQSGYADGAASVTPEDGIGQSDVDAAYQEGIASVIPEDGVSQSDVVAASLSSYQSGYEDGVASVTPEGAPCYSINNVYQEIEEANQPIILDLLSGWNMIGYSCVNESDILDILSTISDKIIIAKNNAGSVYMPEFNFNGIGDFLPNQGYQFKMSETVLGFELCTNPIPYPQIEGCIDCIAMNFNRWANIDDGSCQYNTCNDPQADNYQEVLPCIYYGCNDPLAANYDPYANTDDGSCVVAEACPYENYLEYSPDAISYNANLCVNIIVEGCTDNTAINYNSDANADDNSCEFIYGCIEQEADNYNVEATTDDGSCIYYGCMDPTAGNYNEIANTDDGSCLIGGCMNPTAENYYPDAELDDGSCIIYGCLLSDFPNYNPVANTDDGSCDMNSSDVVGCTNSSSFNYNSEATIDNGLCGIIIFGCTNDGYIDYNELANIDDGSCLTLIVEGCTDISAFNYNDYDGDGFANVITGIAGVDVNTDDGSCIERVYGCVYSTACNYNPLANTSNGTCVYDCD